MNTILIRLNTDTVKEINFLKFKTIMLKEWNENKTQNRHTKLNMRLIVYSLKFNFTKKTLQIGNKIFKIQEYTGYVYRFSKNTVQCFDIDSLYKHFKDAAEQDNVFHTITGSLLKKIAN